MSTNNPLESPGFHGPLPVTSEANDTGLGAFASEWQSDFAQEALPGEADAHQPFEYGRESIGIEDVEPDVESEPIQPDPVPRPHASPRWIFAAVRAVVIFVLGLATFYYTQEPNPVHRTARSAAPKPSSTPAPAPTPSIPAEAPPDLARVSAQRSRGQSAPSADSRPAAAPILSSSATAAENKPTSAGARAPAGKSVARTRRSLAERTEGAFAPSNESSAPAVATPTPEPVPAAANAPAPAPKALEPLNIRETELTQHRAAIHELLDAYRESYDRLDAVSAARLWPGVDTAALARAFSTLSNQQIDFDSCTLDLDHGLAAAGHFQRATALCSGSVTYTRRVGSASPQSRALAWTFDLDRSSGRWLIRRVVAK